MRSIHNKKKFKTGFTLVETMMVIVIFTILALGVNALVTNLFMNANNSSASIGTVDSAGIVAGNFVNQIRNASVGNDGGYPINQASTTQIIFYSSYGQSSGILAKIRYYVNGGTLYEGIIIPTGSPLTYNSASEKIIPVQNNIANTGAPIFYYYDGNYAGISSTLPLVQPVNVTQVKYVLITMNILKKTTALSTSTFSVSAGASIRNLKTNLGD